MTAYTHYADIAGLEMSWKRELATFIACCITGMVAGIAGEALTSALMIGAYMLTGSVFLAYAIYVLGFLFTLVAAFYGGAAVGRYILERRIDRDYRAVKNWVATRTIDTFDATKSAGAKIHSIFERKNKEA